MTWLKAIGVVAAVAWSAAWYLPAWLAGSAWAALRRGWRDGRRPQDVEE